MKRRELIVCAFACVVPTHRALAKERSALELFHAFARDVLSAQGFFEQEILDRNGNSEGRSEGEFRFVRPGKFAWIVHKPYPQTMMSDGKQLWLYDPDLMQVTVKKLGTAVEASPVSILFGERDVGKAFDLTSLRDEDGLSWVQAVPKKEDVTFSMIRIGFAREGGIKQMKLFDHFGRTTKLTFHAMKVNVPILDESFVFEIPKGVDLLTDTSSVL